MNKINKRFLQLVFLGFVIFLALVWVGIYILISSYQSHRVFDVIIAPKEHRHSLTSAYVKSNFQENSILVLGDSQANGFQLSTASVFTTHLQRHTNSKIINLAFKGGQVEDAILMADFMKNNNFTFKTIFFNATPSHVINSRYKILDGNIDFRLGILRHPLNFIKLATYLNPTSDKIHFKDPLLRDISWVPSRQNKENYFKQLNLLASKMKRIADKVVIYSSPLDQKSLKILKREDDFYDFKKAVKESCETYQILCVEIPIYKRVYFIDRIHLSSHGHIELANILKPYL